MANYEPTGVRLVAEGRDEYLNALMRAREVTLDFNRSTGELGEGLRTMSFISTAAAVAVGSALGDALSFVAGKMIGAAQAAIDMTSRLQDTRIGLESLAAQELISAGAADTMTEALDQAVPVTEALMDRLKEISLASPFTYEQILGVFRLNKAFGQSIDMSLELTKAITDLGAVNKGIPGVLERISYNFSQMAMIGQITSRDVRDLAMAGVNLGNVLQSELGMSIEETNKKLKAGQITFEDVSKAFVGYVDKNFGEAAKRASRTFSGLLSSFQDLAFFTSTDVFGGALQVVTDKLGGLFDKAQEFVGAGGLKPVGAALEVLAEELLNVAGVGLEAGASFFDEFGGQIMATANSAFDWGVNVTVQLGAGLIDGAAAAIGAAMDFISGLLSFFLAPGSPPRVAPDIDDWGASAMSEYLRGFGDADFGVLKGVGSALNQALSALVGGGLLDKEAKTSLYQGIQQQLAATLAAGGDLTPVLDQIRGSLGMYGDEIADLTLKQIALSKSLEAVTEAEKALARAREDESQASEDLKRLTDEYNELAKAGASPAVLAAKRAEFEAAKKRRIEASRNVKQAEKALDTSKEESKAIKEKVDLQQELVRQLIDLTRQEKEAEKAKAKSGGAGSGAQQQKKAAASALSGLSAASEEMKKKLEELKESIRQKLQDTFKPIVEAWENARAELEPKWQKFTETIRQFYDENIAPIIEDIKKLIPPELIQNIGWAAGVVGVLTLAFLALAGIVGIVTGILGSLSVPIVLIIVGLGILKTAWDENWFGIRDTLTQVWTEKIQPALSELQTWLETNIPIAIQKLSDIWNNTLLPAFQKVSDFWNNTLLPAFQKLPDFWNNTLLPAFSEMKTWLDTNIPLAIEKLKESWIIDLLLSMDDVYNWMNTVWWPFLGEIADFLKTTFVLAIAVVGETFRDIWMPNIEKAYQIIADHLKPNIDALAWVIDNVLKPPIEWAANFLGEQLTPVFNNASIVLADHLKPNIEALAWVIDNVLKSPAEWAADFIGGAVAGAFDSVSKAIENATGWLHTLTENLKKIKLPDWMTPGSPTPWEMGLRGVNAAMKDLARTGFPKLQAELIATGSAGMRSYAADAAAARLGLLGASSPVVVEKTVQNLTLQSRISPETVQQGFDAFRLLSS